jgi:hypothetical protein
MFEILYFLNGDESGEMFKERVSEADFQQWMDNTEGSIEIFEIRGHDWNFKTTLKR